MKWTDISENNRSNLVTSNSDKNDGFMVGCITSDVKYTR